MKYLRTLIKKTPKDVIKRSKNIDIKFKKFGMMPIDDTAGVTLHCKSRDPSKQGSGRIHQQVVWFNSEKVNVKNYLQSRVQVYCTCEFFNYRLAYALNKYNSAFMDNSIEYAMNNAAKITNPSNRPYLCKHLYAVCRTIYKRGKRKQGRAATFDSLQKLVPLTSNFISVVPMEKVVAMLNGTPVRKIEIQAINKVPRVTYLSRINSDVKVAIENTVYFYYNFDTGHLPTLHRYIKNKWYGKAIKLLKDFSSGHKRLGELDDL